MRQWPKCTGDTKYSTRRGKKMVMTITATEDLRIGALISLLFNDGNQVYARQSSPKELPDAVTARDIRKGESVVFDTGRDTSDLLRPRSSSYRTREGAQ